MSHTATSYGTTSTDGAASTDREYRHAVGYGHASGASGTPVVSFAALAVAIGYRYNPDQVQPLSLVVYFVFAILGGLWFPLTGFLGKISQLTPTYDAVKIGTDVIGNAAVPIGLAIGLIVWLGIFVALATASVRATAETV